MAVAVRVQAGQAQERPWSVLPAGFAALAKAENARLGAEIVREIQRRIPEYARPLDGAFGVGIRRGATRALAQFAELIADDGAEPEESLRVYRALGRGEWREGRSLDALQAAYRLGARLAWRRYSQLARQAGLPPAAMGVLAEAIFAHIDEMAAASVEGYAEARAGAAGNLRRSRRKLAELLAGSSTVPEQVLAEAARAARWELPLRIAGVALLPEEGAGLVAAVGQGAAGPGAASTAALRSLPFVLAELAGSGPCLFIADPDIPGRLEQVERALGGRRGAIGPTVAGVQAGRSLRWARTFVGRSRTGSGNGPGTGAGPGTGGRGRATGLVRCDRQLASVLLLADEELVQLLVERRLAPLDGLTPKQRGRLEATLLAWLETGRGSAPEVAESLGLHPQTVRQRIRRIKVLFGPELAEADARFEIGVALRGRALLQALG